MQAVCSYLSTVVSPNLQEVRVVDIPGFIGKPVADAFVRAGHIVYGQTRSKDTGRDLAKDEIIPVVCDPLTDEGRATWGKIAGSADVGE